MPTDKITNKAREENIPFHQMKVTLAFRFAFFAYHDLYMPYGHYMDLSGGKYVGNPFERELFLLKKRIPDFSKYDQYYWDILFDMNMRNISIPDQLRELETIDTEKEAFIKKELADPNGAFKNKVQYFYGK